MNQEVNNLVYSIHIEWVDYNTTLGKDIYEITCTSSNNKEEEIVERRQCIKGNIPIEVDRMLNSH